MKNPERQKPIRIHIQHCVRSVYKVGFSIICERLGLCPELTESEYAELHFEQEKCRVCDVCRHTVRINMYYK